MCWPFTQLQSWRGKNVAEARVSPLTGVAETVEVKVRNRQTWQLVRLQYRECRTFHASCHAQRTQQVAYERRFARTQRAMQLN